MHSTTRGVKQLTSSPSLKRGGQKDDEEVFIETCQNCSVSLSLGSSSRQKVRSSRPSVGRFPLGLDDLTLWHEELPDFLGNASFLTCFAEIFMEEWTRMKLGSGREKRGSGGERSRTHDFSVLSGRHFSGWAIPPARNLWLLHPVYLAFWTRAPRTAPSPSSSMLRLMHVLFFGCVLLCWCASVGVGMYVCGLPCCACCGVLQRRHNFTHS